MPRMSKIPVAAMFLSAIASIGVAPLAYGDSEPLAMQQLAAQQQNNIPFVTGGIGDEERAAMEAVRRDYNLRVMSFGKDGAFAGDTTLLICDRTGTELVKTVAGPLFYASLPAGRYTVTAENEGAQQEKTIHVPQRGGANLHFVWH